MEVMSTLEERIREVMATTGLTVGELARASKKTSSAVSQWMGGRVKTISAESAVLLQKHTGYRAEWLATGRGLKRVSDEQQIDQGATRSGGSVGFHPPNTLSPTLQSARTRSGQIAIRLLRNESNEAPSAAAVTRMELSENWLRRNAAFSDVTNLALIEGCGDSMRPLFNDGDVLLVDRGVNEIRSDGVYALQAGDRQIVKRVQVRPDGALRLLSENSAYEAFDLDGSVLVLGKIVLIWNAQRL